MTNKFSKKNLLFLFVCIILLSIFYILKYRTEDLNFRIDSAIKKAQIYLDSVYSEEYFYDDKYLNCESPYVTECTLTGRKIDISVNLMWVDEQVKDHKILDYQIEKAYDFMDSLIPDWELGTIDVSYIDKISPERDYGLDAYCTLALLRNSKIMAEKIKDNMNGLSWVNGTAAEVGYRKITDETWCISTLIKYKMIDNATTKKLFNIKLNETYELLENSDSTHEKLYSIIHILLMFDYAQKFGFDISSYSKHIQNLQWQLAEVSQYEDIESDMWAQTNVLPILSQTHFGEKEFMRDLTLKILDNQEEDGGWYRLRDVEYGLIGKSFVTLRAILALNNYKNVYIVS
jgi:hypothetical protein